MSPNLKYQDKTSCQTRRPRVLTRFLGLNTLIILAVIGIILGISPVFEAKTRGVEADLILENLENLAVIQENSLLPITELSNPEPQTIRKIRVVITAYSSTIDQTDLDPFVTAAGTRVRDGIIANNLLPFGTKVRIPEIYGNKVFVVEDRMSWKKGNYHIDIWFPSYWEAKNFGAKRTYIEILEN